MRKLESTLINITNDNFFIFLGRMYNVFFDYAPLFEYENSNFKENSWIFISVTRLIISQEYIYIYIYVSNPFYQLACEHL